MKVKDLMIPLQDFLKPDNTLRDAVNLLRTAFRCEDRVGVKGLPVLDGQRKLIGIISMRDILKSVYPMYMSMMNLGQFTWDGMLESMSRQASCRTVEEIMTRNVVTVMQEDPVMECVDLMVKHDVRRLPVVDPSRRVLGMIYEREVFFAIMKSMLEESCGG